jgi:predicted RNA-binding Zn ribbon-like protein
MICRIRILDFTNTIEPRDGIAPNERSAHAHKLIRREYLSTYAALTAWGVQVGALSSEAAQRLIDQAKQHEAAAQATLHRALELRETIYRVFWRIAHWQTPAADDMQTLLHTLADTTPYVQIVARDDQLDWRWHEDEALDQMLRPVLSDAVALLVRGDPNRIKFCSGPPDELVCGWLFYDSSKNRSRHWCSMDDCGSAAKARRQTARRRARRSA